MNVYPLMVEFDLSNKCNHKCNFCTFKYITDRSILRTDIVLSTISDLQNGVKSINWTGGGEPLTHPDFNLIAKHTHSLGIKQGIFTNGSLMDDKTMCTLLSTHSWVRISLDAGTPETYQKIKGSKDFNKVISNIHRLVYLKKKHGSSTDIGIGFVITPDNYSEIPQFSQIIKDTDVDYGQYKPTINNYKSNGQIESDWWKESVYPLLDEAMENNKKAVVNDYKFKELLNDKRTRSYQKCYGHVFCPCIGATGDVWLCTHMRDIQGYSLGNLYKNSFNDIWNSEQRQEVINKIDFSKCQFCCKNHEINKALYSIKHQEARHHGEFL